MSTTVQRILIVGGGLSGASAAISLRREGLDVEIVEREPVWRALGTGITLMGPALRALQQLDRWDEAVTTLVEALRRYRPEEIGILASPQMSNEDLFVLARLAAEHNRELVRPLVILLQAVPPHRLCNCSRRTHLVRS